ncbi:MAG: ATP-binding protein, partial [Nitrososphaerota archaeon]|nr:ATP-binding protein [Nitrososphaerota archaeon]
MEFDDELIASNLMIAIAEGLYPDPRDVLREYIQNAYDTPALAQNVHIIVKKDGDIIIRDDGSGMTRDELRMALGVGLRLKTNDSVGRYGVGIWSGIAVCDEIQITTRKQGTNVICKIWINGGEIRRRALENKPLLGFLSENTTDIEEEIVPEESDGFTEICLKQVMTHYRNNYLNATAICNYISSNIPVALSDDFEHKEALERQFNEEIFRSIKVFVNKEEIRRLEGVKTKVRAPSIGFIRVGERQIAKYWISLNKTHETLASKIEGICFKSKGFTVGDKAYVLSARQSTIFHKRWVGEIHVLTDYLRPNAPRDSFLPAPILDEFMVEVGKILTRLETITGYVSVNISKPNKAMGKLTSDRTESRTSSITHLKKLQIAERSTTKTMDKYPEFKQLLSELDSEAKDIQAKVTDKIKELERSQSDPDLSLANRREVI